MRKNVFTAACAVVLAAVLLAVPALAAELRIAVMQDAKGDASKYQPLIEYLGSKGVSATLIATGSYHEASELFSSGSVDAMFSGSGVAGSMIIAGLAEPLVRPVYMDGSSTYWAVVLARKGSPSFLGEPSYFRGKRAVFCELASSGEFFYRSVGGRSVEGASAMTVPSHADAIEALSQGKADVAIVKNRVWYSVRERYPNLVKVGEDMGMNPNGTLMVSKKASREAVERVKTALLGLATDNTALAVSARNSLGIRSFTETTEADFRHTVALLRKAGVDKAAVSSRR